MKVKELIEILQTYPQGDEALIEDEFGVLFIPIQVKEKSLSGRLITFGRQYRTVEGNCVIISVTE